MHAHLRVCLTLTQVCSTTLTVTGGALIGVPTPADEECPAGSYFDSDEYCPAWWVPC